MLRYTGQPLLDVGVATSVAFAGKQRPEDLEEADLDKLADYMLTEYVRAPLKSFLTVAFPNSGFTQPAFDKNPEKRLEYARRVLRSYRADSPRSDETCVFMNIPAADVAFAPVLAGEEAGLAPGRAFRQHVPLLTGENVINFYPGGDAGLPVSGEALFAIQAFPLGSAKSGGRLLAVHSDNERILLHFARTFLEENRRSVQMAQLAGSSKLPEAKRSQRTLLIETLLQAADMQLEEQNDGKLFSVTAYHLSNSGQGPGLDIHHLPLQIVGFLQDMMLAIHQAEWAALVRRAWETAPPPKPNQSDAAPFAPRRNWLYEDLFALPAAAPRFVRTYFLRSALRLARNESSDPRSKYSLQEETHLVSWKITERFLRRILHMDKDRIQSIRQMGDRLADYVSTQNDQRFFRNFYLADRPDHLRSALIKVNLAHTKRGNAPLITLEPYIEVFEDGDDGGRADWRLARDLVLIRMIEQLYTQGWLSKNADAIAEPTSTDEIPAV